MQKKNLARGGTKGSPQSSRTASKDRVLTTVAERIGQKILDEYHWLIETHSHGFAVTECGTCKRIQVLKSWVESALTEPDSAPAVARTDGIVAGHPRASRDSSSLPSHPIANE